MSLFSSLLAIVASAMFFVAILYVVFGQVTVRKLRKNPATKNELGIEFVSGWDIINVAGALSVPQWVNRKFKNSQLSGLYANSDILRKHTTVFDRILAKVFYWLFMLSGLSGITLLILNSFGVLS